MRFIHCADIHLDSPLRGQERYEGAPVEGVRGATRRAFENMVPTAYGKMHAALYWRKHPQVSSGCEGGSGIFSRMHTDCSAAIPDTTREGNPFTNGAGITK